MDEGGNIGGEAGDERGLRSRDFALLHSSVFFASKGNVKLREEKGTEGGKKG